jgi:predicted YcjX-like family ATPase
LLLADFACRLEYKTEGVNMSESLIAQVVPMLFASIMALAVKADAIARENHDRIERLAAEHGVDAGELRRLATDKLAVQIGGVKA